MPTPLAKTADDFLAFPYSRNTGPFAAWLVPAAPVGMILLYLVHKPLVKALVGPRGLPKSGGLTFFIALHNLALAVYSGLTFYHSTYAVRQHSIRHGFVEAAYCDRDGSLWHGAHHFGWWVTLFYVSKYYEFLDTTVLLLKGKEPSFLQVYHHVGIAISLWAASLAEAPWVLPVVIMNSFIHTLMYTYFFLSTLGIKVPGAKYLTTAQITQFILGILVSTPQHFMGEACSSQASRFALAGIQLYAVGLIFLFSVFFSKKYKADKGSKAAGRKKD